MSVARCVIALAMIAAVVPSFAATTDPFTHVYSVSGVVDLSIQNFSTTTVNCTSASASSEDWRYVLRDHAGTVLHTSTVTVPPGATRAYSTHSTVAYNDDEIAEVYVTQGSIQIYATSNLIYCTAMTGYQLSPYPAGVSLHMVRFNPMKGSSE